MLQVALPWQINNTNVKVSPGLKFSQCQFTMGQILRQRFTRVEIKYKCVKKKIDMHCWLG